MCCCSARATNNCARSFVNSDRDRSASSDIDRIAGKGIGTAGQQSGRRMARSIDITKDRQQAIEAGCAVLAKDFPIAIPTETVYGLAADAHQSDRDRPHLRDQRPPALQPAHLPHGRSCHGGKTRGVRPVSRALAEALLARPLTLVLPLKPESASSFARNRGSRHRRHPRSERLCRRTDPRLRAPARRAQRQYVGQDQCDERCPCRRRSRRAHRLILDAGASTVGVESTIVKVEDGKLRLLRPGGLPATRDRACGRAKATEIQEGLGGHRGAGNAGIHHAPGATVRLDATHVDAGEALIAFGKTSVAGANDAGSSSISARAEILRKRRPICSTV